MAFISHLLNKEFAFCVVRNFNKNSNVYVFIRPAPALQRFYHNAIKQEENKKDENQINTNSFQIESIPFGMEINQTSPQDALKLAQRQKDQNGKHDHQQTKLSPKMQQLKSSMVSVIGLIEEVTHMDDIRRAQANVMSIKDKLKISGDTKRKILSELNAVRDEMQKIHADMRLANRGSEHHIRLLDQELECLKKERQKQDEFKVVDEVERNLFNNLTIAINDSYEKEKIHANSIRIWGYIQTIVASFITFCISIIGYYYHNTKFGLLTKQLEENVNNTMKSELGTLRDDIILKMVEHEERILRKLKEDSTVNSESWGSYLKRHTVNVYRYFWPKRE